MNKFFELSEDETIMDDRENNQSGAIGEKLRDWLIRESCKGRHWIVETDTKHISFPAKRVIKLRIGV